MHHHHRHDADRARADQAPGRGASTATGVDRPGGPTTQVLHWTDERGSVVRLVATTITSRGSQGDAASW